MTVGDLMLRHGLDFLNLAKKTVVMVADISGNLVEVGDVKITEQNGKEIVIIAPVGCRIRK